MDDKLRILLCEDDENLGMLLREYLQAKGYNADLFPDGEVGFKAFLKSKYDLVVTDVMMPRKDGFTLAQEIRQANAEVPIIFLTAKTLKEDILEGFKIGADDYITKPFSLMILLSKVNALMRRVEKKDSYRLRSGGICLDYHEMKAYKNSEPIVLTKKEWLLLAFFLENPRQILTKEQLLEAVWGQDGQFVDDNTVPVNISRLRNKIAAEEIQTVRGMGYIWTKEAVKEA